VIQKEKATGLECTVAFELSEKLSYRVAGTLRQGKTSPPPMSAMLGSRMANVMK